MRGHKAGNRSRWTGAGECACVRIDDGEVRCWGRNDTGQLGIPDPLNRGGHAGELGDNLPAVPLGD